MDGIASSVPLITLPSFDRACGLMPPEYVLAWGGSCARSSAAGCGRTFHIALNPKALNIPIA